MSCSELELAQRHLSLALKVYDSKKKEVEQAQALMGRLQEQCQEAQRDMEQAESYLHQVERRLRVVVIDDKDDDEEESTKVGPLVAPVPVYALDEQPYSSSPDSGESPSSRHQQSSSTSSLETSAPSTLLQVLSSAVQEVPLSTSLRQALKRHQRKVSRRSACNNDHVD